VGAEVGGQGELAVLAQHLDHRGGGQAGGGGVPQRQGGEAVGVDGFGAFLQFRERRKRVAGLGVLWIVDLGQDGAVALDDERVGGIVLHSFSRPIRLDASWHADNWQCSYSAQPTQAEVTMRWPGVRARTYDRLGSSRPVLIWLV